MFKSIWIIAALLISAPSWAKEPDGGFYLKNGEEKVAYVYLDDDTPRFFNSKNGDTSVIFNGMRLSVHGMPSVQRPNTKWFLVRSTLQRVLMCRTDDYTTINRPYCWDINDGSELVASMDGNIS